MVEQVDGVWHLLNWDKRQFVSDSGKERVQKHREKRKAAGAAQGQYSAAAGDEAAESGDRQINPDEKQELFGAFECELFC